MVVPQAILDNRFAPLSSTGVILEQKKIVHEVVCHGLQNKECVNCILTIVGSSVLVRVMGCVYFEQFGLEFCNNMWTADLVVSVHVKDRFSW